MKYIIIVTEFITFTFTGLSLQNLSIELKQLIVLSLWLAGLDVFLTIYSLYKEKKFEQVKSDRFITGIITKFMFLFIMLLAGYLLNTAFGIDFKNGSILIYILYELKSIDEKITKIYGYSIIDKIISTILFFKNKNKDVQ
jgi:hypothetical protein